MAIYGVPTDSIIYLSYLREKYMNLIFEERINNFCLTNKIKRSDILVKPKYTSKDIDEVVVYYTGEVEMSFCAAGRIKGYKFTDGIILSDLDAVDKQYHSSNPNKYMTDEAKKKISNDLSYEFFFLEEKLYFEIQDSEAIEFKNQKIRKLTGLEELIVSNIRNQTISTLQYIS